MNHAAAPTDSAPAAEAATDSLAPYDGGWHCSHLWYSFDRERLNALAPTQREAIARELRAVLDPAAEHAPMRMQASITSGHKADFGVMMLDPNPLRIDAVHQRLMAGVAGPVLRPGYSFVSVTEISEYVPSPEEYGQRLVAEGDAEGSPAYNAKFKAYGDRLEGMNRQRLTPEIPPYASVCFYPMNKKRETGENWYALSKQERSRMMGQHARSGMAYAGKVSQLITVGLGLDDWEWGVTLWGANPAYLKDIVYEMRFDEASANYAEFGPFLVGYVCDADRLIDHCRVRR
ncbi:putative heme peroxidase [Botrimarina colliarenosi]|uniref:Putative heme peroxidase n=1 Tax=Botrimarina colliarenosi TaxID=2528001 RepID=A0A5C6A508_9BACT|nr:hydrogen peroxide-dependent heme synthase [Botrimarina colliarenosi]TWT93473.1 putative heme peroxidase [Botrimarina colliarenosi]